MAHNPTTTRRQPDDNPTTTRRQAIRGVLEVVPGKCFYQHNRCHLAPILCGLCVPAVLRCQGERGAAAALAGLAGPGSWAGWARWARLPRSPSLFQVFWAFGFRLPGVFLDFHCVCTCGILQDFLFSRCFWVLNCVHQVFLGGPLKHRPCPALLEGRQAGWLAALPPELSHSGPHGTHSTTAKAYELLCCCARSPLVLVRKPLSFSFTSRSRS